MRVRSWQALIVCALTAATLVAPGAVAHASAAIAVSGTWTDCNLNPDFRAAGPNLIGTVRITETFFGDFDGTYEGIERNVVFADGGAVFFGVGVFTGSVAGRTGTVTYRYQGILPSSGPFRAHWVVSNGTGGLSTLRGQGTFDGVFDASVACPAENFAGSFSGSYEGSVHFHG